MVIKGVIFDLDGTLLDTENISTEALDAVLQQHGDYKVTWEVKEKIIGMRDLDWAKVLIDHFGLEGRLTPQDFADGWHEHLLELWPHAKKLPGAERLVSHLHDNKIPMAVCTSSSYDAVAIKRAAHEAMFAQFQVVACGDDPEVKRGKPEPDLFLLGARRLGIPPAECIVFEDAIFGCMAAKAAGCVAIAVPEPRQSRDGFVPYSDEQRPHPYPQIIDSLAHFVPEKYGLPPYPS